MTKKRATLRTQGIPNLNLIKPVQKRLKACSRRGAENAENVEKALRTVIAQRRKARKEKLKNLSLAEVQRSQREAKVLVRIEAQSLS